MNLPDTENAHYHYAFKKGYRMAMDGKPMSHMPSRIRRDPALREYFQMGWNQLQEELANGEQDDARTPWRSRFAWFMMMLLAGIGTASLMVTQINEKKDEQQARIDAPASIPKTTRPGDNLKTPSEIPASPQPQESPRVSPDLSLIDGDKQMAPNVKESPSSPPQAPESPSVETPSTTDGLSLLSPQARQDLAQTRQEVLYNQSEKHVTLAPVQTSDIQVEQAVLAENVLNLTPEKPLKGLVPKYVRKVFFFTRIDDAAGKTIYHRWIYQNRILATVPLKITSPRFRTWSSKRLSSAWPGQWHIEVLDDQGHVIYRYSFNYIK